MSDKRLYRSRKEKYLAGVCGGIAEYFNIDPTVVRLIWAFVTLLSASVPGVLIYIVCAIVIPEEPVTFNPGPDHYYDINRNDDNSNQ